MKSKLLKRIYKCYFRNFIDFYSYGNKVSIAPFCDISKFAASYTSIGNNVHIHKEVWLNIDFSAKKNKPIIVIEDGVVIGRRSTISGINKIIIGKNTIFAPNVFITDHLHEHRDKQKAIKNQGVTKPGTIIIEEGCWLGHCCSIIASEDKEVVIGKNSTIAANSVVTKSFPKFSTIIGIPARNVAPAISR